MLSAGPQRKALAQCHLDGFRRDFADDVVGEVLNTIL